MLEIKKKFIEGLKKKEPQILIKNLNADVETPISCLLKLKKNQKYSFLLESVEGGSQRGRYSLLGCDPDIVWKVSKNIASIKYYDKNYKYKVSEEPIQSLYGQRRPCHLKGHLLCTANPKTKEVPCLKMILLM